MTSSIVGPLTATVYDPEYFESEPFPFPYFNDKKMKVGFTEAGYAPYMDAADKALKNFIELSAKDRMMDTEMVYHYYAEILKLGYTPSLNISNPKDIWNFVTPAEIVIHWDEDEVVYLCVSSACEWEEEHGLQMAFKNGHTLTRASGHDGHFED